MNLVILNDRERLSLSAQVCPSCPDQPHLSAHSPCPWAQELRLSSDLALSLTPSDAVESLSPALSQLRLVIDAADLNPDLHTDCSAQPRTCLVHYGHNCLRLTPLTIIRSGNSSPWCHSEHTSSPWTCLKIWASGWP